MAKPRKCAVRDCTNRQGEGQFKGSLCFPCYAEHYIKHRDKAVQLDRTIQAAVNRLEVGRLTDNPGQTVLDTLSILVPGPAKEVS